MKLSEVFLTHDILLHSILSIAKLLFSGANFALDLREGLAAVQYGQPCRKPFFKATLHAALVVLEWYF